MLKRKPMPSREFLIELLDYCPETGKLTWKDSPSKGWQWKRWVGKDAGRAYTVHGTSTPAGIYVGLNHKRYAAHRIAWVIMTGEDPEAEVDHVNVDPYDNRWVNLRKATHSENGMNKGPQANNTSGIKGVTYVRRTPELPRPWMAQLHFGGRMVFLGYHETKGLAAVARAKASLKYHGQFARL